MRAWLLLLLACALIAMPLVSSAQVGDTADQSEIPADAPAAEPPAQAAPDDASPAPAPEPPAQSPLEAPSPPAPQPAPAPPPDCSVSLQSHIDAAAPGSVLVVPACIYHETVIIRKPLTLDGQGRAEIRGSDVWTDWTAANGSFVSTQRLPAFSTAQQGVCADGGNRCNWPEQVFVDGTPFTEVAPGSLPGATQFALDSARHIVLHDDPTGHTVEVTTRERWVDTQSDNVTIQGFAFWHAANAAETGAIGNQDRTGWTLQDSKLYYAHGGIVSLGGAKNPDSQTRVLRNEIAGSGYEGINGLMNVNTLIQGNRIFNNNLSGFDSVNWAGAGVKVVGFTNLVLDQNDVYNNNGPGLWCDINCQGVVFSNNRIHDNRGAGILFEISSGARIFNNVIWGCSPTAPAINISSSSGAEVYSNVLAWNNLGIAVFSEERSHRPGPGTVGISIHDNTILAPGQSAVSLQWFQRGAGNLFEATSSNSGASNNFWYPSDEDGTARFRWQRWISSIHDFTQTPSGSGARYLSAQERDQVLSAWGIPRPGGG
jgi:parallel beta-helix repeat protein